MKTTDTGVLGKIVQHPIDTIEVLTLDNAPDTVTAHCTEVDGLCPVTHQPDHYIVDLTYEVAANKVIESKALKLYLWGFRDKGISCEAISATIATDLHDQYQQITDHDTKFTVTVTQQSRGGIALTATTTRGGTK